MIKIRYNLLSIAVLAVTWCQAGASSKVEESDCILTAGFDNTAPFHYRNKQSQVVGIDADILRSVAGDVGCEIRFKELPWSRTLSYVEQGKIDIAIGAGYKDVRAQWGYYSSPYKFIDHGLYTKKQKHDGIDSLELFLDNRLKLGTMLGWGYPPEVRLMLDKAEYKQQVIPASNFTSLLRMLKAERVDGIMAIPSHLKRELDGHPDLADYRLRAVYREPLHFVFSKKSVSSELVTHFNNALFKFNTTDQRKRLF